MKRIAIAAVGALLVSAAVGTADTAKRNDPKGDLKGVPKGAGGFDFKVASVKHDGGKLVHRIESWNSDPPGFPVVRLELQTDARSGADWYVKKTRSGAAIFNAYNDNRVGRARFIRHSGKAFSLKFDLDSVGSPPWYAWRWRIIGPERRAIDAVPNKGFVGHALN